MADEDDLAVASYRQRGDDRSDQWRESRQALC